MPAIRASQLLSVGPLLLYALVILLVALSYSALFRRKSRLEQEQEFAGIVRVHMSWAGVDNDKWLREQRELYILLKDGKSFFEERRNALRDRQDDPLYERLVDRKKVTQILIVHPHFRFIDAVANADPKKAQEPQIQIDECLQAVRTMQAMASEAMSPGIDITKRNTFSGYHLVPTYNATFGDENAHINFYYTRPYRGNLISLECRRLEHGGINEVR
jgi:hypothetical protein